MLRRVVVPLAWLPLWLNHALGVLLGWIAWAGSATYRRRLGDNLRQSGLYADEAALRALRWRVVGETGKGFMELFPVWLRGDAAALALVREIDGEPLYDRALARGRGVILVMPHLGCIEIVGRYLATRAPVTYLYRPPRLRWLEPLMRAGRERGMARLAPTDAGGVRALLTALRRGEAVVVLPDQTPPAGSGVWAPFFGRPAYTMTLVRRLQRASGAAIVLMYAERLPAGRGYRLAFLEPREAVADEAALNREVERLVSLAPAQYLWSYHRYKVPAGETAPAAGQGG